MQEPEKRLHFYVGTGTPKNLVAEFISPKKYTFSFIVGNIFPKSVKCIHSATKKRTNVWHSGARYVKGAHDRTPRADSWPFGPRTGSRKMEPTWVLVKEVKISYHNKETMLSTIDPYYGNLSEVP